MIYITLFCFLILLRYSTLGNQKLLLQLTPLVWLLLFIFASFRFEVGCDWPKYRLDFDNFGLYGLGMELNYLMEPAYFIVNSSIKSMGLSYVWVNLVYSAIFFTGIWVFAKRQKDPLATIVLMFPILMMNMPMSGIRQGAAIGVICMAYVAFIDKKSWKFIALVILGATFHSSALIFLVLLPFMKADFTLKRLFHGSLLALPIFVLLAFSTLGELASMRYVDATVDSGEAYEAAGALYRVGFLGISAIAFILFYRKQWKRDSPEDFTLMILISLMMIGIFILLPISSIITDRLGYYLIPIQVAFFARLPYMQINNWRLFWISAPYIMSILIFSVWILLSSNYQICYDPYNSWLFGLPDSRSQYYEFWQ